MKTLYNQIEAKFLPFVESYKTDITKHDFATLETYKGRFLYGARTTGTDFFKLDLNRFLSLIDVPEADRAKELKNSWFIWILHNGRNKRFAIHDGDGKLKEVTELQMEEIAKKEIEKILLFLKQYEQESEKMYLDFVNNFLTLEKFAKHYNITEEAADKRIIQGRKLSYSRN